MAYEYPIVVPLFSIPNVERTIGKGVKKSMERRMGRRDKVTKRIEVENVITLNGCGSNG